MLKTVLSFALGLLAASVVHADQDISDLARSVYQQNLNQQSTGTMTTATSTTPASTNAVNEGTSTPTSPIVTPAGGTSTPSINPSAAKGQSSQSAGQMMNIAAAAALFAACFSHSPPNWALCAMGGLAAAQGAHDGSAADMSGLTFDASSYQSPNTPSAETANGNGAFSNPTVAQGMKALGEGGYKVTASGVTMPDGTTVPASSFNSPSALTAAGFDPNAVAEAKKVTDALNTEMAGNAPHVSGVAVASSGGGGGGAGSGGYGGDGDSSGNLSAMFHANPFSLSADDRKKLVAGKTVMFDGEPIGVRGSNIFEMVHAVYQKKRAGKHFIETESGASPVQVRMPASLIKKK
jgi:hypothetical protein